MVTFGLPIGDAVALALSVRLTLIATVAVDTLVATLILAPLGRPRTP